MAITAIALGGNLGDVPASFFRAATLLQSSARYEILAASRLYQTRPIGSDAGQVYTNAAVLLRTDETPHACLEQLKKLELEAGRVDDGHWRPRPLDLDILSWDDKIIDTPTLKIPHPLAWRRRFVLDPWCDIAPDWKHPILQETVGEMQARLSRRPLRVHLLSPNGFDLSRVVRDQPSDQENELTVFALGPEPDPTADAQFYSGSLSPGPRSVELPEDETLIQLIQQALFAMWDTPVAVTDGPFWPAQR